MVAENRFSFSDSFSRCVLGWYRKNGRCLPWREDLRREKDPALRAYRAWVAETMLQQTTVATVLSRYRPFLERFPSVDALADASLESLLHEWQGLGYYARARRLLEAAQSVAAEGFPFDRVGWRALSGVGEYTASALSAFVGEERVVVMDTNIRRVYSRIFATTDGVRLAELAEGILPSRGCGDYTQALMDLGAIVCKAGAPRCGLCPVRDFCEAYRLDATGDFPVVRARAERPLRRATVLLVMRREGDRRFLLFRRSEREGLLGGLSEFPSSDFRDKGSSEDWDTEKDLRKDLRDIFSRLPMKTARRRYLEGASVQHGFTHFRLRMRLAAAEVAKGESGGAGGEEDVIAPYFWQEEDMGGRFGMLAMSTLMRKVLAEYARAGAGV